MKRIDREGKLIQSWDGNSCAIHALMNCMGISFSESWHLAELSGRIPGEGTYSSKLIEVVNRSYNREVLMRVPERDIWYYQSLVNFIKEHPVGRFYLRLNGHAIALVNGEVLDTTTLWRQPNAKVRDAWVLKESWVGNSKKVYSTKVEEF